MVSDFHWKLIIAGSVGGACAFFSSILVFAILACRHQRKLKRLAAKRANHRRTSTQYSHSTEPSEPIRGFNDVISSADLPLPIPPNGNYIQPAFGVGPFWMGQNSINHDSGCADLESNRTDSASFGQMSFSPLPRTPNGRMARTLPSDTFPAMSNFDIDSTLSHSFDLLSPPALHFGFMQNDIHTAAKSSDSRITVPSNVPPSDKMWKPYQSCCGDKVNIRVSCQESRGHDFGVQLVEIPRGNYCSRSTYPSGQASILSSSDNDDNDPIWIRRTSIQPDGTLTRSMVDRSDSDPSVVWRMSGAAPAQTIKNQISHPVVPSRTKTVLGNGVYQRNAFSNPSRGDVRKQNGFLNPQEVYSHVRADLDYGATISN